MELTIFIYGILVVLFMFLLCIGYSGAFSSINISVCQPELKEGVFVYKFYQQNYKKSGEAFRELRKLPIKHNYTCIGIYYDDPDKLVDAETARSAIGIYFPASDLSTCEELVRTMQDVGYSTLTIPTIKHAIVTKFPYRTMLSIPIAVYRVYKRLVKFAKVNKLDIHCIMEIYPDDGKIHYVVPLEFYENFYAKECTGTEPATIKQS